ncbi:MAG: DUF362 domain-containing protein [Verrucomicrobiae bacterium]|nr:DUF362 domain-containing protein [Verrucomicrobiae bacterium]
MRSKNCHCSKIPVCPGGQLTRRDFLKGALAVAATLPAISAEIKESQGKPQSFDLFPPRRSPVGIALCNRYEFSDVRKSLKMVFDRIGGIRNLVRNKRVTVKVNLVNTSAEDVYGVPLWLTVTVHPVVAKALGSLLVENGAKEVIFCDQLPFLPTDYRAFVGYGFNLSDFNKAMNGKAKFVNTRNKGDFKDYAWVKVPNGELATAWEVNRVYTDTDVIVSLAKLKNHVSAGITGGMKNLFGIPPSSLYGDELENEPKESAVGYRTRTMHNCDLKPLTSAESFTGKSIRGDHGFNVPRFIVDLAEAFPIDLVVIDGISAIQTAEGWWNGSMVSVTRPGVLIAGRNAVCADAVAAAVMGFDPDAPDKTLPFVNGTNYLALARKRGLGENRLSNIEVFGVDLAMARFEFQPTFRRVAP